MRLPRSLAVHPLLLAAYPVLFLYAENLDDVPLGDIVAPLGRVLICAAATWALFAFLFRDARRGAIPASVAIAAFLVFNHIADLLAPAAIGLDVQQVGWFVLIGLAGILAVRLRDVGRLTTGLNAVAVVLVVLSLTSIVPFHLAASARAETARPEPVAPAMGTGGRDIYYLVFDRYGSSRALDLRYGVQTDMYAWLESKGFLVVPDAHANYVRTSLSLAGTLSMGYLDDVAREQGPRSEDFGPIHGVIQDHAVGRYLQARGYRYFHVGSWFGPTRSSRIADVNIFWDEVSDFEAEFLETTAMPQLAADLDVEELSPEDLKHREAAEIQLDALESLRSEPGPKFVLAHVLLPHDPYVFDENGGYVTKEERQVTPVPDLFRAQLEYTNARIRGIVEPLLALPEAERPIIIVQADEGPYPVGYERDKVGFDWETAPVEDLEVKFGILDAMYLPGASAEPLPPRLSSVNTFRVVFSRMFGEDLPLLPDRVLASRSYTRPYDLVDVTERIPSAVGG